MDKIRFKFGEKVNIIGGFYKGSKGEVRAITKDYKYMFFPINKYLISLDLGKFDVECCWIEEEYLVSIS